MMLNSNLGLKTDSSYGFQDKINAQSRVLIVTVILTSYSKNTNVHVKLLSMLSLDIVKHESKVNSCCK